MSFGEVFTMITIISGTNRSDAVSFILSKIYKQLLDDLGVENQILDLNDLPEDFAFSALYHNSGQNDLFNIYREKMLNSEKFVFIVAEYNGSFPGVLKTFIDGLEFPGTFHAKKCALVGISSGVQGGGMALSHLTDIFNYCGMNVLALKPKLSQIDQNLDREANQITNDLYKELLETQAGQIVAF